MLIAIFAIKNILLRISKKLPQKYNFIKADSLVNLMDGYEMGKISGG